MTDSHVVAFLAVMWRIVTAPWRWLGDVDRILQRTSRPADRDYARATAVIADSRIARALSSVADRWNPSGSYSVTAATAVTARVQRLSRWQQVRLAAIVLTTALMVHAALSIALPSRFAPRLPAIVWIGVSTVLLTLILAARAVVAAWNEWSR
jgi:hypothetical protein